MFEVQKQQGAQARARIQVRKKARLASKLNNADSLESIEACCENASN